MVPSIDDILADDNLTSDQTLLLIAISRHAHADGTGAYPSLRRLAALTKFSLSHICTLLSALEKTGYLTIERFKGPKGVNTYTLHVPSMLRSAEHPTGEHRSEVRVLQVHRSGESEVQAEEKNLVRVQEEELRTEVLRSEEQQSAALALTPAAARWLQVNGSPGGIASQSCGIETLPPSDTVAASTPSDIVRTATESTPPAMVDGRGPDFSQVLQGKGPPDDQRTDPSVDTSRTRRAPGTAPRRLGKLCPRAHDYQGTGQSMRRWPGGSCVQCDREQQQARARARNPTPRTHKPYARKEGTGPEPPIFGVGEAPRHRADRPTRRVIDLATHRQAQGG